jgi:hypothetical protein
MKRALLILSLCACVAVPMTALAQQAPPSPSPEMRALMDKIHGQARTAAYAALTPAHVASVTSIAGEVAAKKLDFPTAVKQIDALITVAEEKAVWAAAAQSRREMFAAMREAGGPGPMMAGGPPDRGGPPHFAGGPADGPAGGPGAAPGGAPRGGPMGGWQHGHGRRGHGHGRPSASGYLLMVSMTPDQMRQLMPRARSSAAP